LHQPTIFIEKVKYNMKYNQINYLPGVVCCWEGVPKLKLELCPVEGVPKLNAISNVLVVN
jgi:hypothetical protein